MARYATFDKKTLQFLNELARNNNRDWFNENKSRYENDVLDVALRFIQSMQDPLEGFAPHFTAIPKRMGGSLMRVYRDTRFSKNKTPYKTNIGIQFRHQLGKDVHAPGFYMHIDPKDCFVGIGLWRPDGPALLKIREAIVERRSDWRKITRAKKFRDTFELGGDTLVRPPKGFDPEDPDLIDLKRKDFVAVTNFDKSAVTSDTFVKDIAATFRASKPFMSFLCRAVDVPF